MPQLVQNRKKNYLNGALIAVKHGEGKQNKKGKIKPERKIFNFDLHIITVKFYGEKWLFILRQSKLNLNRLKRIISRSLAHFLS